MRAIPLQLVVLCSLTACGETATPGLDGVPLAPDAVAEPLDAVRGPEVAQDTLDPPRRRVEDPLPNELPLDADPSTGATYYAAFCASCHGPAGEGGVAKALDPEAWSAADLTYVIHHEMPPSIPSQCQNKCATEVATFILDGFTAE